jgi:hypothetical protein
VRADAVRRKRSRRRGGTGTVSRTAPARAGAAQAAQGHTLNLTGEMAGYVYRFGERPLDSPNCARAIIRRLSWLQIFRR